MTGFLEKERLIEEEIARVEKVNIGANKKFRLYWKSMRVHL